MNEYRLSGAFSTRVLAFKRCLAGMKPYTRTVFKAVNKATASLVVAGLCGQAGATTWTDVYYELGNQNSLAGDTYIAPAHITDNSGLPVNTTQSISGKATISAYASPGILKTSVWTIAGVQSLAGTGVSDISFTTTQASFFDQITANPVNPALNGQTVTIDGFFLLSGSMQASWYVQGNNSVYYNADTQAILQLSGTGITGFVQGREIQGSGGTNVHAPAPSIIPVSFTTTLGSVTGIQYNMNLQGSSSASFGFRECDGVVYSCGATAGAEQTADFSHTLLWGGISSVTDVNGNPVALNSALGQTGFNYLNAAVVPIPAAAWLFGSGLLGLIGMARRKKKN